MKPIAVFSICAALIITCGCGSITDRVIDGEVQKVLDEHNKKLPADMENGVVLVKVDYDDTLNQITMKYTVGDRAFFDQYLNRIKLKAHQRVRKNKGLQRAMENGIRLFHEFRVANPADEKEGEGKVLAEFETEKR